MNRVIVIGCPGSGKSTFSRELSRASGIPVIHLDSIHWKADGTNATREEFLRKLQQALEGERWICDGNYGSTMELRLQRCDTVFFLDLPTEACLEGIRRRKGQPRSDMPWKGADEDDDPEFVEFIRRFPMDSLPEILALLEKYPDRDVYRFTSHSEAEGFLRTLYQEQKRMV